MRRVSAIGLASLWAAMALGARAPAQAPLASPEACRLGAVVVAEQAAGTVFDASWPTPAQSGAYRQGFGIPEFLANADIPQGLKAAARTGRTSNLFQACPSLAAGLPAGDRMATAEDLATVNAITGKSDLFVTTLMTPVVDRTGTAALVYEFHKCLGLCGSGYMFLYRKARGRWVKSKRPIYYSVS